MKFIKYFLFSVFCCTNLNAQSNVKITFSNSNKLDLSQIKSDLPEVVQKQLIKQIEDIRYESFMNIEKEIIYYQTKAKKATNTAAIRIKTNSTQYHEDPSVKLAIPESKYLKNSNKKTITFIVDKKLLTQKISTIAWKKTNKKKKILGYNCFETTGKLKGKTISIWYTNEIKAIGTPEKLPFINGVVLEYTTENRSGSAIKIEFNQAPVKNFFKK